MLSAIFGIVLVLFILLSSFCLKRYKRLDDSERDDPESDGLVIISLIGSVVLGMASVIIFIGIVITGVKIGNSRVLTEKIEFYRTNNQEIELRLENTVNAYLEHESQTYTGIVEAAGGDLSAILIVLPELNSSTHILKLLETYETNNELIRKLELEKIDVKLHRWWLYFG